MRDAPFFFYGTLRRRAFLSRVVGRPVPRGAVCRARLDDFRRVSVAGRDDPTLIPADGKSVEGIAVGGLAPGEVDRLIRYEGRDYEIAWLPVGTSDGRDVVARVFVTGPRIAVSRRDWRKG